MAPRSQVKPVASFIPFTRFPGHQSISVLLWRFRSHSPLQSARFFHELVIPSPPDLDQDEYREAIDQKDHLLCEYVDLCFPALFSDLPKRIRNSKTVLRIPSPQSELILLPVRPLPSVQSDAGIGVWFDLNDILERCQARDIDCNFGDDRDVYLPTMALFRAHADIIVQHLNRLGLEAGQYEAAAAAADPVVPVDDDEGAVAAAIATDYYSCARCNRALFNGHVVERHEPPSGSRSCASVFLSDSVRVFGELSDVSGKLSCPHCGYRLGSYDWSGTPCSCGIWLAPAIQITASRVDSMKRRQPRTTLA